MTSQAKPCHALRHRHTTGSTTLTPPTRLRATPTRPSVVRRHATVICMPRPREHFGVGIDSSAQTNNSREPAIRDTPEASSRAPDCPGPSRHIKAPALSVPGDPDTVSLRNQCITATDSSLSSVYIGYYGTPAPGRRGGDGRIGEGSSTCNWMREGEGVWIVRYS